MNLSSQPCDKEIFINIHSAWSATQQICAAILISFWRRRAHALSEERRLHTGKDVHADIQSNLGEGIIVLKNHSLREMERL